MKAFSRWTTGLLVVAFTFAAITASPAIAQNQSNQLGPSEVTRAQVEALLGAHEDFASPARWRSLGDAAIPILESIAADQNVRPTRRARSLDGLAALVTGHATMRRLANSDGEPLIVRMSALRGLGQVLPELPLIDALRPLLQDSSSRIRGMTAETLAHTPAGCAEIKDMVALETEAWRSHFARRCGEQTPSEDQRTERESKTVVDTTSRVVAYRIVDPPGDIIFNYAGPYPTIAEILPSIQPGSVSVLLPNSPTVPFASGGWTFNLLASQQTTVDVQAIVKTSSNPILTTGKLRANLFFVGVPGLNAGSAPTDPNFQAVLLKMRSIYAQIGVELGDLTYIDITGADAIRFTDVQEQDLGALFMLSKHPKARDGAINIFLVDSIVGGGFGFIILGESAGIPGTPIRGTPGSGLVVTMADFPFNPDSIADTIAHETGHSLGLFHTTEFGGTVFDPLPDTPECPQINFIFFQCPDATNLMFPFSNAAAFSPVLTPNQQFVILRNPVVTQRGDPEAEGQADVSSIRLGSFPVYTDRLSSPITVNVPQAAVSLDFVGVAKYTLATIRVPRDFPTIQLAVDNAKPLDTIRVGPGRWCGATITKALKLVGERGTTIIGCPPGVPGPFGSARKRGFRIAAEAAGTSIRHFVFDGNGVSLGGDPLFIGIEAAKNPFGLTGADNLVIDSNEFQGTAYGISLADGKNSQVTHNVFDGFTVVSDGEGGVAILMYGGNGHFKGNSILYNQITSTVPAGDLSGFSWVNEADVPLAGIVVSGQDGTIISNNKVSITANAHGDGGAGIIATDNVSGLTTINLTITNNDGRGSAYDLIITKDLSGGTGNSVGATIRGNLGTNLINGSTSQVNGR